MLLCGQVFTSTQGADRGIDCVIGPIRAFARLPIAEVLRHQPGHWLRWRILRSADSHCASLSGLAMSGMTTPLAKGDFIKSAVACKMPS